MDIGSLIAAIVVGLVAGFIARALVPGKDDIGLIPTVLLGIAGSFLGFLVFTELLGIGDGDKFDAGGIPGAVIGAIVLLLLYNKFVRGDTASHSVATPGAVSPEEKAERREARRQRRG